MTADKRRSLGEQLGEDTADRIVGLAIDGLSNGEGIEGAVLEYFRAMSRLENGLPRDRVFLAFCELPRRDRITVMQAIEAQFCPDCGRRSDGCDGLAKCQPDPSCRGRR